MLFIMAVNGYGQNLVPNPSFEDYSLCPDNWAQIDRVDNWEAYKGSPDYFNSCEPTNSFSTPQNLMGNQIPVSGNSYTGLILYSKVISNGDEIIGTQLTQNLQIGIKYYLSFKIILKYNNAFSVCCGNNKIGAKFSTQSYSTPNPPSINNSAHIWTDSIITDTLNWTQVFGSFVADSSYSNLMIGNFFSNANIDTNDLVGSGEFSYYFFDDVCVSTDSSFCANYIYTGIEDKSIESNINIYPNPANNYFNVNNKDSNNPINIKIYNTLGQELFVLNNVSEPLIQIDISEYTTNLLFIKIESKNKSFTYKLLKP